MTCIRCGRVASPDAHACAHCGAKLLTLEQYRAQAETWFARWIIGVVLAILGAAAYYVWAARPVAPERPRGAAANQAGHLAAECMKDGNAIEQAVTATLRLGAEAPAEANFKAFLDEATLLSRPGDPLYEVHRVGPCAFAARDAFTRWQTEFFYALRLERIAQFQALSPESQAAVKSQTLERLRERQDKLNEELSRLQGRSQP